MPKKGSEVLLERWKKGPALDEELVRGIVNATQDLEIRDILIKGQPKPDFLRASAATDDPERCGTVVGNVLAILRKHGGVGIPTIRVFPKGVPEIREYIVDIAVGQQPGF